MTTWWIGSKDDKNYDQLFKAMEAMKLANTVECDDLAKEHYLAYMKSAGRWDDELCGIHPTPEIFFDGGGSVRTKEPMIGWEANGTKQKTFVRHLPFVLEAFQGLKPDRNLPSLCRMGGFCRTYLLAVKTVRESIEVMERLQKGTESLRQELELDAQAIFNGMTKGFNARTCGCLSGKIYVECCGKFVESPGHKELRESTMPAPEGKDNR